MSSTLAPYGLSAQGNIGGKYKGETNVYPLVILTTSIGIQDTLSPLTNGGVSGVGRGVAANGGATAISQITGVSQGVEYINAYGQVVNAKYFPANTSVYTNTYPYLSVNDDPYSMFNVQCNAAVTNGLPIIGKNYDLVINNANSTSGISTMSLGISTYSSASVYRNVRVIGLASGSLTTNSWSDLYPDVKVVINNHAYRAPTIGL